MYNEDKKIYLNGYVAYYYPEHPRASSNGCVYEHILVAEKILNRYLNKEECVHHIDGNRSNNSFENLMVFATKNDHMAYHKGVKAILNENGVYYCPDKSFYIGNKTNKKNICPICRKNIKSTSSIMCLECRNKERAKNIPSKEELSELIGNFSMSEIGRKYNVTSKAVEKWCKKYNILYKNK